MGALNCQVPANLVAWEISYSELKETRFASFFLKKKFFGGKGAHLSESKETSVEVS